MRRPFVWLLLVAAALGCTAELDVLRPHDGVCLGAGWSCDAAEDCCSARCEGNRCVEEPACREVGDECESDDDCCTSVCSESACVQPPARS